MIKEVIQEITAAESMAEEIIAKASEDAKSIALSLHAESEAIRSEYAARIKLQTNTILGGAEESAAQSDRERLRTAEINAAQVAKSSEKNVMRTVEWLAEQLIKQNS